MCFWPLPIHPPVPSAWKCSPRRDLMKGMVGEIKFYSNVTRQSQNWEVGWKGVGVKDLLFDLIFSFCWCAKFGYFKTSLLYCRYRIQLFNVCCVYLLSRPAWVFPTDLWRFWIAPRCEHEWKVCVLGSPVTHPECISVLMPGDCWDGIQKHSPWLGVVVIKLNNAWWVINIDHSALIDWCSHVWHFYPGTNNATQSHWLTNMRAN